MRQIRELLSSRFRLVWSSLALAVLLAALAITPARAETICEDGCVNWSACQGCIECQHCCSYDDGSFDCHAVTNKDCGTGGPGPGCAN